MSVAAAYRPSLTDVEIVIRPEPDDVAATAAAAVAAWLGETGGDVSLGLAGGSTPRATYLRLLGEAVAWERVTGWLADERWVPSDHPESNAGMVRETLFDHVSARLLEVPHEMGDPDSAAAAYEAQLARVVGERPDVVLLGIGGDGHTASLFPDTAALEETERRYVSNWVEAQNAWRVTATFPLLWSARRVAFIVTGAGKAGVIAAILGGADYPAGRVARGPADVTWFLDAAAAADLDRSERGPI